MPSLTGEDLEILKITLSPSKKGLNLRDPFLCANDWLRGVLPAANSAYNMPSVSETDVVSLVKLLRIEPLSP